jgi:hypothetical protein
MNWNKAKTHTITFLVILNCFLLALVFAERNKYNMDSRQTKAIIELLNRNNIQVTADIPTSFQPMKQLAMSNYDYDLDVLLDLFFPGAPLSEIIESSDEDKMSYAWEDMVLTIQNGYISCFNPSGDGKMPLLGEEAAEERCLKFLKTMPYEFPQFTLDNIISYSDGYIFQYYQVYKGNVIIRNKVEMTVTELGIVQVDCTYSKPIGFTGNATEICSPDEALLNVMQRIKSYFGNNEVSIGRIDLVYSQEKGKALEMASLIPVYRVYVEEDDPFLLNAYTNTIY